MIQRGPFPALCRVADEDVARTLAAWIVRRVRSIPPAGDGDSPARRAYCQEIHGTRLEIRELVEGPFDLYWPVLSREQGRHALWRRAIQEWGWRLGYVSAGGTLSADFSEHADSFLKR